MTRTGMMRTALGGLIGIVMLAATACSSDAGPTASASGTGKSGTDVAASGATGASGAADPLVGIWESAPRTTADVDANLRGQFHDTDVDSAEAIGRGACIPNEGDTHVVTLHFGGGQLVISDSRNAGASHEGWTGVYAVQDSDTFAAADANNIDNLYITVDYTIEGNQLFTDLISDRLPDHSPWSDAQDGPGSEDLTFSKPVGERMCAVGIYETTPFTKVG
jgi:hypothetical protein